MPLPGWTRSRQFGPNPAWLIVALDRLGALLKACDDAIFGIVSPVKAE
jgi:hypothetical protein